MGSFVCHLSQPLVPGSESWMHIFQIEKPVQVESDMSVIYHTDAMSCDGDKKQELASVDTVNGPMVDTVNDGESDGEEDNSDVIDNININVEDLPMMATAAVTVMMGTNMDVGMSVCEGMLRQAPTQAQALEALKELKEKLCPPRKTGCGYKDPELDPFVQIRMEGMQTMLNFYMTPHSSTYEKWGAFACQTAISTGHGRYCACQLSKLAWKFIEDRSVLPINPYGNWHEFMLVDEDLASDINLYLQELGSSILAHKVIEFLAQPDVKEKHGITKSIDKRTAHQYLNALGFRWASPKKGQYANGHEHADVVWYCNQKFLPQWREIKSWMQTWTNDNVPESNPEGCHMITWFHDEMIFYTHD